MIYRVNYALECLSLHYFSYATGYRMVPYPSKSLLTTYPVQHITPAMLVCTAGCID